jgi:glycosyltransferase involved in cell wall biosynthesis
VRILIISDAYARMRGGVPSETRQLLSGLLARGHDVALCSEAPPEGVVVSAHFPITLPTSSLLVGEVAHALSSFRPDIVHILALSSQGLLRIRDGLAAFPWLLTCHSLSPFERKLSALHGSELAHYAVRAARFFPNELAWRWIFRSRRVPQLVVHSASMAKLTAAYGQPSTRIETILLGVDAELHQPARNETSPPAPRLVTIAGIAHTKGYHDALMAMRLVRKRFPGATYQIIGEIRDTSYLRFLKRLMRRWDLSDAVRITPNLPEAEKQLALANCDLYLQPSHEEGFCLAYIEAAQVVARLVGTDTGAIGLISEHDAGARVVPARSPAIMAAAIEQLLAQRLPDDLMQLRMARLRSTLDWSRYFDAHEALYTRLRGDRPTAATQPRP